MSKIIIENTSQISDRRALHVVSLVMCDGFVSGPNQYCYVSTFFDCVVYARETRGKTYSFKVLPNKESEANNEAS
jgi:hypothetical protein